MDKIRRAVKFSAIDQEVGAMSSARSCQCAVCPELSVCRTAERRRHTVGSDHVAELVRRGGDNKFRERGYG